MKLFALACVLVSVAVVVDAHRAAPPQLPRTYTNLQVLPKDASPQALIDVMKMFTSHLGTRCEHCHVGEGNDLSTFDFASDAKPEKATARKMMALITAVNRDLLKGVGDPAVPVKVTCYTCHRGTLKPPTAPAGAGGDLR